MGGPGSGRWRNHEKAWTVESCAVFGDVLDVAAALEAIDNPDLSGPIGCRVSDAELTVKKARGKWWLECPCGRLVLRLYRPPSERTFACRKCHRLTYESVQKHDARVDRAARDVSELERLTTIMQTRRKDGAPTARATSAALVVMQAQTRVLLALYGVGSFGKKGATGTFTAHPGKAPWPT